MEPSEAVDKLRLTIRILANFKQVRVFRAC